MDNQRVFELLTTHPRVIYRAVHRLGVPSPSSTFDAYLAQGRDIYLAYGQRYVDPVETPEEVVKFNRLAGYFVFRTLCHQYQRARRDAAVFEHALTPSVVASAASPVETAREVEAIATAAALWARLTARERAVFRLCFDTGAGSQEVARQLGVSQRYVNQVRQRIRSKYLTIENDGVRKVSK